MKDNRGRVKWAGILLALALIVAGCNDFIFETPEFDNPHDPKNAGQEIILDDVEYRDMVSVLSGTFTQGNSFDHTISTFEIAKYQVTYELWYTVRQWGQNNGYTFANPGREGTGVTIGGEPTAEGKHEPVTSVSWRDAIVWANAYSELDGGRTPVYYANTGYTTPIKDSTAPWEIQTEEGSIDNPNVDWGADGYRLPTEGEWQFAARWRGDDNTDRDGDNVLPGLDELVQDSGVTWYWTPILWVSGADANSDEEIDLVAWHIGNSGGKTQAVGQKLPNQLGVHDMGGNIEEWLWDWSEAFPTGAQTDYLGPPSGDSRVFYSGAWDLDRNALSVGSRNANYPDSQGDAVGFRLARTP